MSELTGTSWASSEATRRSMIANKSRDTGPELALRHALHRDGLRFLVNRRLPVIGVRRAADAVFPTERIAVFMDGCFWHGCPIHCRPVGLNDGYWNPKLNANVRRDRDTDRRLRDIGWCPVRVWEHEVRDPVQLERVVEWVRFQVTWWREYGRHMPVRRPGQR